MIDNLLGPHGKDVCIVAPPAGFLIDPYVFPPLGALAVATGLHKTGYNVQVYDGPLDHIPEDLEIYGVSCTTPQFRDAVTALHIIRDKSKGAKVYVGGPHPTVDPQSCIKAGFDGVIMGEGEQAMDVAIRHNASILQMPAEDVEIDRSFIDLYKYKYKIGNRLATTLVTSRGCPYNCAFCCKSTGKVRMRSAEKVVEELEYLKDCYDYTAFMFFDDVFIMDKKRLLTICAAVKDWDIRWRCFVRADLVCKHGIDVLMRMYEAGCEEVGMGIESGSDQILKTIRKGETTSTIKRAIDMLNLADIRVKGFFIVGLPGESPESIEETWKLLKTVQLSDVDITICQPFMGSDIWNNKEKYDIDWNGLDYTSIFYKGVPGTYKSNVRTSKLSADDILAARDHLEAEFKQWH